MANTGCVPKRILFLFTFIMYCCLQYAYNYDILLHHNIAPWTLTLMLIHQSRGLWVRIARKACWLAYCKMQPDAVGHPGIFGIRHLTYYVLGHTKSFYGILNSMVVWILEHTHYTRLASACTVRQSCSIIFWNLTFSSKEDMKGERVRTSWGFC